MIFGCKKAKRELEHLREIVSIQKRTIDQLEAANAEANIEWRAICDYQKEKIKQLMGEDE